MKRWRIRTRRDWIIAAGFLLLLSYLIAVRYQQRMNEWLMNFSPEKMSYFNQPENHGVYLLAAVLAAMLGTLLWIWQRRMAGGAAGKGLMIIWAAAAAVLGVVWIAYQAECRQIVNTPYAGLEPNVSISRWEAELPEDMELTGEEQQKMLELLLNVQALPREEQEIMREQMTGEGGIELQIWYPEYKGHSYHLWFHLEEDRLCLYRGHSIWEAVFYDGTEAQNLTEEILEAHEQ